MLNPDHVCCALPAAFCASTKLRRTQSQELQQYAEERFMSSVHVQHDRWRHNQRQQAGRTHSSSSPVAANAALSQTHPDRQ